jgi:thiol-disulfide isomerase/thioredoxin
MTQRLISFLCIWFALLPLAAPKAAESGQPAPNCTLTSLDKASSYNLQQYRGKVVYVDFWASWCPPCAKSFPFLNDLERDLKSRGLQVVAINLDEELEDAKAFLAKQPANFAVALDVSKQCAQDFQVMAMPSSYLIDRKGIVRHTSLGFKPEAARELRVLMEQLLKEPSEKK